VFIFVHYETIKRDLNKRLIIIFSFSHRQSKSDERLEPKDDESTCLAYTGWFEELEHLKIETRLIDEKFTSVMGEFVI
jgi:hypothetical protein